MTETANNYARVLYELPIRRESIEEAKQILAVPQVGRALESPVVPWIQKQQVIGRLFPEDMQNFLKVVCRYQKIDQIQDIFCAYDALCLKQNGTLKAVLMYVTPPMEEQKKKIIEFLKRKFHVQAVDLKLEEDKSLAGGFVLSAQGHEFDWSLLGRYKKLRQKLMRR